MDWNELRARALHDFRVRVRRIAPEQWHDPTPCAAWDVRALVHHLTWELLWSCELGRGKRSADIGGRLDGDVLGDDPLAAFDAAAAASLETFRRPDARSQPIHASFGDISAEHYLKQMTLDALVHGWDLAVATGQPVELDEEVARQCWVWLAGAREEVEAGRRLGVFGPEVPVPSDAAPLERLVGLLGRDPTLAYVGGR